MKHAPRLSATMLLAGLGACASLEGPQSDASDSAMNTVPSYRALSYTCEDGRKFTVRYLNNGNKHVAILPVGIDASELVLDGIPAASGARYAAGSFVWWTKGRQATLYEHTNVGRPEAGISCKQD